MGRRNFESNTSNPFLCQVFDSLDLTIFQVVSSENLWLIAILVLDLDTSKPCISAYQYDLVDYRADSCYAFYRSRELKFSLADGLLSNVNVIEDWMLIGCRYEHSVKNFSVLHVVGTRIVWQLIEKGLNVSLVVEVWENKCCCIEALQCWEWWLYWLCQTLIQFDFKDSLHLGFRLFVAIVLILFFSVYLRWY